MTQGTKTLLWVLGGAVVVGAAGTAIYFATKKQAQAIQLPQGPSTSIAPKTPPTTTPTPKKSYEAAFSPETGSFAQWLADHSHLIDSLTGNE